MNKLKCLLLACLTAGVFSAVNTTAATSSNTIVRFQLRHGQIPWGNVDVELFDSLKPITVSNFLSYVRSGAFDRSILHRAVPGFAVQGGQYKVQNPYVETPLTYLNRIPEGPPIPSEATNSPVIPNTFGTLAMSLSSTNNGSDTVVDTGSATTSWYFNTGDNSTNLTEYTVFGKVKAGDKYLKFFNTIYEDEGIINMYGIQYLLFSDCDLVTIDSDTDVGLSELPVFYFSFACPSYSDLFNVQISILSAPAEVSDTTNPKLKIIYPALTTVITADSLTVTGTVTDNVATESLRVYLGSNSPASATVTGNAWSLPLTNLPAGTNHILVEASDGAGNRVIATSRFFFKTSQSFTNFTAGTGTGILTGVTNRQPLDVGRIYTISAKPDPGNFFIYWARSTTNGSVPVSGDLNYRFFMETNLALIALFETNLFPFVKGIYQGLFVSTNIAEQQSSGYITLSVSDRGAYSGKLFVAGETIPLSGNFGISGSADIILFNEKGLPGFTRGRLNLNLIEPNNRISGWITNYLSYSVTNLTATNFFTNSWSADLTADRIVFNAKLNPAPQAGKYTMILPTDTNSAAGPAGDGYGTVTVTPAGAITFAGMLADGTKVSQKTFVSEDGHWPFYIPLYKTNGTIVSWIAFTNEASTDFGGLFNWFKQTNAAKYYAAGFTNEATIQGSRYLAPNATNQMLYLTNGTVGFTNGNLAADFTNNVALDPKGKVTSQDANKFKLSISSGNGLMSGSVTPPTGGKSIPFKGVILQKQTNASGYFLGTNASGRVYLGR